MDALFIRSNDSKAVYGSVSANAACEPPFWAAVMAAYCRGKGDSVGILDAEAADKSPDDVAGYVKNVAPSMVILVVTGTNLSASTWKMNGALLCAEAIKASNADMPVMMWGLHPSALPDETLEEECVDFVMKGEGIESIHQFIQSIGNMGEYDNIDGLFYKKNGMVCGNVRLNLVAPDDIPEPAWDMLPMERYKAHNWQRFGSLEDGGYAVIATSLGCPFQCSFCAVSTLFGEKKVRYISPQKVVEMIDHLVKEYQVKYIKLLDENFVLNMKHVEEICNLLIERNYDLNIWAYARVDTVNRDILSRLRKAGIRWLAYGIESASELSLSDVSKGQYDVKRIEDVVRMTKDAGIYVLANFMFGLPEDTKETMRMTLDFARKVNPEFINFYCTMAYPGSKLYSDCKNKGIKLPDTWLGYSQFSYECEPLPTKMISSKEVLGFRDYAFEEFFKENNLYFKMIEEKFGKETVQEINNMLKRKMKRKLLGD